MTSIHCHLRWVTRNFQQYLNIFTVYIFFFFPLSTMQSHYYLLSFIYFLFYQDNHKIKHLQFKELYILSIFHLIFFTVNIYFFLYYFRVEWEKQDQGKISNKTKGNSTYLNPGHDSQKPFKCKKLRFFIASKNTQEYSLIDWIFFVVFIHSFCICWK